MKIHLRPQQAFTLIELITVIAIMSILMALLFPAIAAARENARRTKASTVVKDIVNSCKNYAIEYGKFPPVKAAAAGAGNNTYVSFGDTTNGKCKTTNNELFYVLRAISAGENTAVAGSPQPMNPRQQKYFEQPKAIGDENNPRDGFVDGSFFKTAPGQLMDPWGRQYCIVLDTDGNDEIDLKTDFYTNDTDANIRSSAVAFSMARDGYIGTSKKPGIIRSGTQPPDDVISW